MQYTYDAAGNITGIQRQSTSTLAITGFTPTSGPPGAAVTVFGAGFSATAANNTVTFNGTTAVVSASDSGSIATTVPAGATTGKIAVTVAGTTVTSTQDFTVTPAGSPTITSFTPTSGASGVSVAVTGTNFETGSGATTVKLNGVNATASASSTTALSFTVPSAAASGRIAATNSIGTGTSTTDFLVPPPGLATTDIIASIRIAAGGGNSNIAVGTAGKTGLVLFDGTVNGWYSLQFNTLQTSPSGQSVTYKVIKPDNTVLVSGTISTGSVPSIHLPKLPATGTYTLQLSPGTATLNTNVRLEANAILAVDGAAAATTQDYANQSTRFVFDATANQRIGVGALAVAFTPSGSAMFLSVYKPDGSLLGSQACNGSKTDNTAGNCDFEILAPVAGTYSVNVESSTTFYTTTSVQLNSYVAATLVPDVTQAVTLARVGQDAAYTFAVNAGDSFGIDISAASLTPQTDSLSITVKKPDGTTLSTCSGTPPASIYCELGTLATAGTYTVLVDPNHGVYGTFNLTLKQGPLLATTDSPSAFAPSGIPESARIRFNATAGQNLTVGVSSFANVGTGGSASMSIYRGNAALVNSATCNPSVGYCRVLLTNLSAGTYSAVIQPANGVKITGNIVVSGDLSGTLVAGTPQTVTANRAGQRAAYTFSGTAGDSTSVKMYGMTTTPASQSVNVTVLKPDGTSLASSGASAVTPGIVNLPSLPTTGTYTVTVDPSSGYTWQGQLALDPGVLLAIDGTTATLATTAAGEPLRYRFAGTSGQRLDFGVLGLTYSAGSGATFPTLYRPDGGSLSGPTCNTAGIGGCDFQVSSLPSTGTYSVIFQPPGTVSISGGTVAVSTPLGGTFTVGGSAQTLAISRAGQTARYTFSGTAAQLLRLNWSSVTVAGTGSVTVNVLKPDGSVLTSSSFSNGVSGGVDIASLPSTGTYTVVLDPSSGATMSASIALVTR